MKQNGKYRMKKGRKIGNFEIMEIIKRNIG